MYLKGAKYFLCFFSWCPDCSMWISYSGCHVGNETTRVCVRHPVSRRDHTSLTAQSPQESVHCFLSDTLIFVTHTHTHVQISNQPNTHAYTHKTSFALWCSSIAGIHFQVFKHCLLSGTAVCLGLTIWPRSWWEDPLGVCHIFSQEPIQRSLVRSWHVYRAARGGKVLKVCSPQSFTDMNTRSQDVGSYPSTHRFYFFSSSPECRCLSQDHT